MNNSKTSFLEKWQNILNEFDKDAFQIIFSTSNVIGIKCIICDSLIKARSKFNIITHFETRKHRALNGQKNQSVIKVTKTPNRSISISQTKIINKKYSALSISSNHSISNDEKTKKIELKNTSIKPKIFNSTSQNNPNRTPNKKSEPLNHNTINLTSKNKCINLEKIKINDPKIIEINPKEEIELELLKFIKKLEEVSYLINDSDIIVIIKMLVNLTGDINEYLKRKDNKMNEKHELKSKEIEQPITKQIKMIKNFLKIKDEYRGCSPFSLDNRSINSLIKNRNKIINDKTEENKTDTSISNITSNLDIRENKINNLEKSCIVIHPYDTRNPKKIKKI